MYPLLTAGFLPGKGTCKVMCGFSEWEVVWEAEKPIAALQLGSLCFRGSGDSPFTRLRHLSGLADALGKRGEGSSAS